MTSGSGSPIAKLPRTDQRSLLIPCEKGRCSPEDQFGEGYVPVAAEEVNFADPLGWLHLGIEVVVPHPEQ